MTDEDFLTNVARMIAASVYSMASMQAAHDMYAKSYFALGVGEKMAVDQVIFALIANNYQAVTPENLKKQGSQAPVGFQVQPPKTGA